MQRIEWSLQDAKNKFSEVVNAADAGEPQIVTKRGIPTAVVLSVKEFNKYKKMLALKLPTFTDHLLNIPVDDSDSILDDVFERLDVKPRDIF